MTTESTGTVSAAGYLSRVPKVAALDVAKDALREKSHQFMATRPPAPPTADEIGAAVIKRGPAVIEEIAARLEQSIVATKRFTDVGQVWRNAAEVTRQQRGPLVRTPEVIDQAMTSAAADYNEAMTAARNALTKAGGVRTSDQAVAAGPGAKFEAFRELHAVAERVADIRAAQSGLLAQLEQLGPWDRVSNLAASTGCGTVPQPWQVDTVDGRWPWDTADPVANLVAELDHGGWLPSIAELHAALLERLDAISGRKPVNA